MAAREKGRQRQRQTDGGLCLDVQHLGPASQKSRNDSIDFGRGLANEQLHREKYATSIEEHS